MRGEEVVGKRDEGGRASSPCIGRRQRIAEAVSGGTAVPYSATSGLNLVEKSKTVPLVLLMTIADRRASSDPQGPWWPGPGAGAAEANASVLQYTPQGCLTNDRRTSWLKQVDPLMQYTENSGSASSTSTGGFGQGVHRKVMEMLVSGMCQHAKTSFEGLPFTMTATWKKLSELNPVNQARGHNHQMEKPGKLLLKCQTSSARPPETVMLAPLAPHTRTHSPSCGHMQA